MTQTTMQAPWLAGRYTGGSQWGDGQFYVWDKRRASICNPDTGGYETPYRWLGTGEEVTEAAQSLNAKALASIHVWGAEDCFLAEYEGTLLTHGTTDTEVRAEAERLWHAGIYNHLEALNAKLAR